MAQPAWLIVGHVAVTWALVGLIWTVHVVHYPLFASVGSGFRAYHEAHMSRMTIVVGPLMLAEIASAFWLWSSPPAGTEGRLWLVSLILLGVVWLETALFAVPQHGRLASGFEPSVHRALMAGNLVRTLAWTARGVVVAVIAARWVDGLLAGAAR